MTRLVEMGIEPFLVGSSRGRVLAQRLVRRLCDWCKEPYRPTDASSTPPAGPHSSARRTSSSARSVAAPARNTGYRGRLAVNEVMPVSEEIERLTVAHASASEIAKVALAEGMTTLREDGLAKVNDGMTTLEEVLRVTV